MGQALSPTITSYKFLYEEERQQMMLNTLFVCAFGGTMIRFDISDHNFWSFGKEEKIKLSIKEVRSMPEVKLFKIDLKKFTKM